MIAYLLKVLHGDLAARNVLVTEEGVAKVADFGMSRKLYEYFYYRNPNVLFEH